MPGLHCYPPLTPIASPTQAASQFCFIIADTKEIDRSSYRWPVTSSVHVAVCEPLDKSLRLWSDLQFSFMGALQNALGKDKVVYMGDSFMPDYGADGRIDQATSEALDADVVILFLGTSAINPHTLNTVSAAS